MIWLLLACGPSDLVDTAGPTESDDTGESCTPPADGLLPPGDWASWEQGAGLSIDERGRAFAYQCTHTAGVDRAEVVGGAVSWPVHWGVTNDTGGPDGGTDGTITGNFCGDEAALVFTPLWTGSATFVLGGAMPEFCD